VALGQLSQGSGNLLRQTEMLKILGAKTTKSIGMEFDEADDPALLGMDGPATALASDAAE
jgi:DNA recombination protein RmuC